MGPGVDNDTRTSSFNQDCLPLLPPRPPKPKHTYDYIYNHTHVSGIQPLAEPPTKCSRRELKDPTGTAEKKARATQQHLDRLGKLASLAKTSIYQDHKGGFITFAQQCRGQQCLADTKTLPHPAGPFLEKLQRHGMPVILKTSPLTIAARDEAMQYGAYDATLPIANFKGLFSRHRRPTLGIH